jgi:endonuclease/exonuclease/phosphatase family metal-dependent hydrolase
MQLRLVTWNLHGPPLARRQTERFREASRRILTSAAPLPDLVLLQEIWFSSEAARLIALFEPQYQPVDVPRTSYPGRAGGLLTFVRRDTWSVAEHSFEIFSESAPAWRVWEGDGMASKGVQCVVLKRGSQRLAICNTHLQAQYGERGYTKVRAAQIEQLDHIVARIPLDTPVVSAGDFNTRPREELYGRLASTWIDLTEGLRQRCGCGTTVSNTGAEEWIDYVFSRRSPAWTVQTERAERLVCTSVDDPSDHHGLDVTFSLTALPVAKTASALALAALHGPSTRRQWLLGCLTLLLQHGQGKGTAM